MSKDSQLRCLAVQQPYAWAICAGIKNIENRSWQTKHRGTIVIVASGKTSRLKEFQRDAKPLKLSADHLTVSAAIGIADIVDIQPLNSSLEANPWASGPYCWQLANGRLFKEPIPCKGKLNLYNPDDDLAARIGAQMPTATAGKLDTNAAAWIEAMKQRSPDDREYDLIENYWALEDWNNVLRLASEAQDRSPADSYPYVRQAGALIELERYQEALDACNEVLRLNPDDPDGYQLRGITYTLLHREDEAEKDFVRLRELDPECFNDIEEPDVEDDEQP